MEANAENLQLLAQTLSQTLNPATIKQAEAYLSGFHGQPGYSLLLLTLLQRPESAPSEILSAAAVEFKNFVSTRWKMAPEEEGVPENDRLTIKAHLVELMLGSPHPVVQKQLSSALSTISDSDFPSKWPNLLPDMVAKLQSTDYNAINGVLRTLHSINRKFRYAFVSEVEGEFIYVVTGLCLPLLGLFRQTMELVRSSLDQPAALLTLMQSVLLQLKLFYTLSYPTLPELVEDHLEAWMTEFRFLVTLPTVHESLLEHADVEEKPGVFLKVQALVCDILALYMQKYEEEFEPYLQLFVGETWQLLMRLDVRARHDRLVIAAMGFLQTVSTGIHHKLFDNPDTLKSICEQVIIPNITMSDGDVEMFEDEPEHYIARDSEGSDSHTRRRAACELVKGLRKHFEEQVSSIFTAHIAQLLEKHATTAEWRAKDAAMYLVTALSVTTSTQSRGASTTNPFVRVLDFYAAHVLPELQSAAANGHTDDMGTLILRADALRFSSVFRQTLPQDTYPTLLPLFVSLLSSPHRVVHTYAAACVDHFLGVRDKVPNAPKPVARVTPEVLTPMIGPILVGLFALMPGGTQGQRENQYVVRALLRVVTVSKESILPHCEALSKQMDLIVRTVAQNPLNATFNHYMFEIIAALIVVAMRVDKNSTEAFEALFFPTFQFILTSNVTDFAPYVFQLISMLLEETPKGVTPPYESLLPPLLSAQLWENSGNIPGLVRLLQAYARRGPLKLVPHIEPVLGVFQSLLASRTTDHEAFYLLESLIEFMPPETTSPFLQTIFQLIFARLKRLKTAKLVRSFTIFLALFFGKHDASAVAQTIEGVGADLFGLVLTKIWLPNANTVTGQIERKIVAVGSIKLLTGCDLLMSTYVSFWPTVANSLVALFELPEGAVTNNEEDDVEIDDTPAYSGGASFNKLAHAVRTENDPFADIDSGSLKALLAQSMGALAQKYPGQLPGLISQMEPQCQAALAGYMSASGVTLA